MFTDTHADEVDAAVRVGVRQLDGFGEHAKIASGQDGDLPLAIGDPARHGGHGLVGGVVTHASCKTNRGAESPDDS